jgi:hypothetical protein
MDVTRNFLLVATAIRTGSLMCVKNWLLGALLLAGFPLLALASGQNPVSTDWQRLAIKSVDEAHGDALGKEPGQVTFAPRRDDSVVKPVQVAKGKSSAVIRDRIVGRQTIDYQVQAAAGQRMTVSLKGSNGANYFNLLPPESDGAAMAMGELLDNRFEGMLPDDGVYTIRVFLYRAAARRNEASDFTLSVGVTGTPLKPVSASKDAMLPGTRYHASATTSCEPAYSKTRQCEVFVVRRGFDGTATVELRWDGTGKRRILFVKGEPKAADASQPMTFIRNERGWAVKFGDDERFEIPEPLVFGG